MNGVSEVRGIPVFPDRFADALNILHELASTRTGLSDFGDEAEYMPGLKVLLQNLEMEQGRLSPLGKHFAFEVLTETLVSRATAVKGWKDYPECLEKPVNKPIIILGLPRTGTTALFHLLSLDPQFQVPERWLIESPMPRPPRDEWQKYPGFQKCVKSIQQMGEIAPQFLTVHQRGADLAEECLDITSQCFISNLWGTMFPVPGYDDWWQKQPHLFEYVYLKKFLQLIGAKDDRRWLLKDPSSLLYMNELKEVFPDISVIVTHRDPLDSLPSVCSLISTIRESVGGGNVDLRGISPRELSIWSKAANKLDPGKVPSFSRRADVYFSEFMLNPMGSIKHIYEQLNLTLSREVVQAMLESIKETQQKPRKPHHYSLEKFGLEADQIKEKFSPYIQTFKPFKHADE